MKHGNADHYLVHHGVVYVSLVLDWSFWAFAVLHLHCKAHSAKGHIRFRVQVVPNNYDV